VPRLDQSKAVRLRRPLDERFQGSHIGTTIVVSDAKATAPDHSLGRSVRRVEFFKATDAFLDEQLKTDPANWA
jgi:hypothetical protein